MRDVEDAVPYKQYQIYTDSPFLSKHFLYIVGEGLAPPAKIVKCNNVGHSLQDVPQTNDNGSSRTPNPTGNTQNLYRQLSLFVIKRRGRSYVPSRIYRRGGACSSRKSYTRESNLSKFCCSDRQILTNLKLAILRIYTDNSLFL